jgi:hypothetical protein
MIYTVECSYSDPASEEEWNDFYSLHKLPALISVQGFHTSQRFRACGAGCPIYLALHSIDGLEVLQGDEYARKGGGNFARWQQHITDWHRNLYSGLDRATAVEQGDYLLVSRVGPEPLIAMGTAPDGMHAVALDRAPAALWLARLPAGMVPAMESFPSGVYAYAPMTAQLKSVSDAGRSRAESHPNA